MAAGVIIRKYTGKDGSFGTLVSSLGIKRVDTCVPAVYSSERLGGKVIPADAVAIVSEKDSLDHVVEFLAAQFRVA